MKQEAINCRKASFEELVDAMNNRKPITGIERILTHCVPVHIDEIAAMFVAQETYEGRKLFPGLSDAKYGFTSNSMLRKAQFMGFNGFIKALQKGFLLIGVGEGKFDEHSNREKRRSSFQLMVDYLDLKRNSEGRTIYGPLLAFINHEDNNGDNPIQNINKADERDIQYAIEQGKLPRNQKLKQLKKRRLSKAASNALNIIKLGGIASNIKKNFMVAKTPEEQFAVLQMGFQFIKGEIGYQTMFLHACYEIDSEETPRRYFDIGSHCGVVVTSTNPLMKNAVFYKIKEHERKPLMVSIIHNPITNQFVISPARGLIGKKEMQQLNGILRQKLYMKKNHKPLPAAALREFGSLRAVPELYFDENQYFIANGSFSDPDSVGLVGEFLSIDEIIDAICIVVEGSFQKEHADNCVQGKCAGNKCPLYYYHLRHCDAAKLIQSSSKSHGNKKKPQTDMAIALNKALPKNQGS